MPYGLPVHRFIALIKMPGVIILKVYLLPRGFIKCRLSGFPSRGEEIGLRMWLIMYFRAQRTTAIFRLKIKYPGVIAETKS
ncbi:MAG: hypothetical protein AB3N24_16635, partial [Leisingera sp.]